MIPSHRSDLPHRSEEDQQNFFLQVLALACEAEARCGAVTHDISIAGTVIRLIFAGGALEPFLLPALRHRLAPDDNMPGLILHIWDSASTGVTMCPPPVEQHCFSERGDIWSFHSSRVRSAFHWSEFSLNLLDLERGEGVFWVQSADGLPYWTQASPFRTLLHWWMEKRGAQLVHAAAIGTSHGGVLITGRGGVGKSTTAIACLAAGFSYVGDDYVLLTRGETVAAYNLYRSAKINPAEMGRFERFSPQLLGGNGTADEKAVMFLDNGIVDALPLLAVLTPRFGHNLETWIEPVDQSLLLGAATYTTICQLPHAGQHTVDFIEEQLARLAGCRLVLGRDVDRVPAAIAQLLERPPGQQVGARSERKAEPLVSVIIPVYNGAQFLPEAVGSVLAQGYPKVEIIVVDDGSTDAISEAVAALPVQVRYLRQVNGGAASARNLGIRAASADIIAFLDVDDLWPARMLETLLAWLADHAETDVVIGRAQLAERKADGQYEFVGSPAGGFNSYIGSGLYRRHSFERNGLFDPLLRFGEDFDWFVNAERTGTRVDRIDVVTLHVRRHPSNSTRGMTDIQLTPIRLIKNALDRKRTGLL
jgi:hypothetical protein